MRGLLHACTGVLALFMALPVWSQPGGEPKAAFVEALGRFSLALEGRFGDEGAMLAGSIADLRRALDSWDVRVAQYEAAMAAEIGAASPELAVRMHLALAGAYLDRLRPEPALRELLAARALEAKRPDLQTLLGVAQQASAPGAALDAFRQAVAADPDNPIRTYVLARELARHGQADAARSAARRFFDLARAGAIRPVNGGASAPFIRIALVPEHSAVEPFFPPTTYAAGFAKLTRGEFAEGLQLLDRAVAADPLAADAGGHREALARGAAAFRDGRMREAIEHLTAAVALAPGRAEPLRVLGVAYAADDQHDTAIDALRQAVTPSPGDERTQLALADVLMARQMFEEAGRVLRDALAILPASGRAHYTLGRVYQRQGRFDEAIAELELAVDHGPLLGLNGIHETLATIHASRQDFARAARAHSARVDAHPNDPDAHHDLGEMYLRLDRQDEALAEFTVALSLKPDHRSAAAALAQAHLRQAEYEFAAAAARRALEIDPAHSESRYVLATALIRSGSAAEGKRELEVYRQQQAARAEARTRLLEIEALRREAAVTAADARHAETVAALRKVLALDDSYSSHLELGLALLDAGEPGEALEHLNAAAVRDAPYEVHRYLAVAYGALGRPADSQREQAAYERIRREVLRRRGAQ